MKLKCMKKISFMLTLVLLASSLSACSSSKEGAEQTPGSSESGNSSSGETTGEKVVWKLSHDAAPGQAIDLGANKLAELVKERTEGRLEIEVFPNNLLGPSHSTREMIVDGSIQMVAMGGGFLTPYNGVMDLYAMLYNVDSREELMYLVKGDWGKKWLDEPFLQNQGLRLIDHWPQANRELISTKPVRSKADLAGLKIRVPAGMPLWEASWSALGAMSLSLALEDAFTGMQQGVVDAVELPIDYLYSGRFMEEAKYLTITDHQIFTELLIVNDAAFQALSAEDQQILLEAVEEAGVYATEQVDAGIDAMLDEMVNEYGVEVITLTDDERKEFSDAIAPLYNTYMENWGQDAYDDYLKAREEFKKLNQ